MAITGINNEDRLVQQSLADHLLDCLIPGQRLMSGVVDACNRKANFMIGNPYIMRRERRGR